MALITASDVSLGYDNHLIVKKLNFSINTGDYLYIVGENGSGKSTLMKTLLGLLPPISGSISFGDGIKAGDIGYLPQQTIIQKDFPASVREIVISGCQGRCGLRPFYNREEKKLADDNMKRMDVVDLKNRPYRELSGGQQQRVLLARALCATQKLLLLDEPVAGLDPNVSAQMYDLIEKLNREGITVIMISHDVSAAIRYASHILHIGEKIYFGTRGDYLESEAGRDFLLRNKSEGDKNYA
nr:ABC transporter ATP-binding protein [uncultured Butyrivibrio sp.]